MPQGAPSMPSCARTDTLEQAQLQAVLHASALCKAPAEQTSAPEPAQQVARRVKGAAARASSVPPAPVFCGPPLAHGSRQAPTSHVGGVLSLPPLKGAGGATARGSVSRARQEEAEAFAKLKEKRATARALEQANLASLAAAAEATAKAESVLELETAVERAKQAAADAAVTADRCRSELTNAETAWEHAEVGLVMSREKAASMAGLSGKAASLIPPPAATMAEAGAPAHVRPTQGPRAPPAEIRRDLERIQSRMVALQAELAEVVATELADPVAGIAVSWDTAGAVATQTLQSGGAGRPALMVDLTTPPTPW